MKELAATLVVAVILAVAMTVSVLTYQRVQLLDQAAGQRIGQLEQAVAALQQGKKP